VVLRQLAQELERDVGDDLDMHPRVVIDAEPRHRVHVCDVPPRLQLVVGVDALEDPPQLPVAPDGDVQSHLRDGLGRRQAGLSLGLGRDRLFDSLLGLAVERHDSSLGQMGATLGSCFGEAQSPSPPSRCFSASGLQRRRRSRRRAARSP
jgi:hypothetical protein